MRSFRYLLPFVAAGFLFALAGCSSRSYSAKVDTRPDQLDFENPPIAEEEFDAQQRGEVPPKFDIPIVRNAKVEHWIAYFQGRGRKWFTVYMERSGRYIPFMKSILREHDLPEDLVYLSMIESGFSTKAYSRARAVGPWQFMKGTGRLYGLDVNFWVDERRDPERSTIAAARHLKDLFDQFQSWKLAAAAYNAGAGKVSRAIQRYRTEDFWELSKGRYLRPETRHYVPKLIAAALIAKEPEKYGFTNIQFQDPLQYDKIVLETPVNLIDLARVTGMDLEELFILNPELNHPVTPPQTASYELRIPYGNTERFMAAVRELTSGETVQFAAHRVRRGDSLPRIAGIYRVKETEIRKLNRLGKGGVRQGQMILIPVPLDNRLASISKRAGAEDVVRRRPKQVNSLSRRAKQSSARVHVVKRGESLGRIARKYGITVADIKEENNLRRNVITPGKRLVIPST